MMIIQRKTKNRLKNTIVSCLILCLLITGNILPVAAVDQSQSYAFTVTVNEAEKTAVEPGETVDLVLRLSRTDDSGPMTVYAVSSVLRLHSGLLEIEDLQAGSGISSTVTQLSGSLEGWSDITLNFLAPSMDGVEWENGCALVTLKLKAARYGSSMIQIRRGSVSTYSGMESYETSLGSAVVSVQKIQEESVQPIEPTTPEEPGDSSDPSQPSDSTIPSGPSQPSDSTTPSGPLQPSDSTTPSGPSQPSDSTIPSDPSKPADPASAAQRFADVAPDAWYAGAVEHVSGKGYFNGTGADEFSPELTMTRAMFVTVLSRVAGIDSAEYQKASFTDVPEGQWYSAGVEWASANGIVTGYDSETFGPEDPVTREQMAAILYRYAKYRVVNVTAVDGTRFQTFSDADQVSDYAKAPMIWATDKGLISGMGDGSLAPQETATRAQVAQIIMNYDQNIV